MMMYFDNEEDFRKEALGERAPVIQHLNYHGPGYYEFRYSSQRCPRGCCYDDVVRSVPLASVISETREKIRELADRLRTLNGLAAEQIKMEKKKELSFALREKEES